MRHAVLRASMAHWRSVDARMRCRRAEAARDLAVRARVAGARVGEAMAGASGAGAMGGAMRFVAAEDLRAACESLRGLLREQAARSKPQVQAGAESATTVAMPTSTPALAATPAAAAAEAAAATAAAAASSPAHDAELARSHAREKELEADCARLEHKVLELEQDLRQTRLRLDLLTHHDRDHDHERKRGGGIGGGAAEGPTVLHRSLSFATGSRVLDISSGVEDGGRRATVGISGTHSEGSSPMHGSHAESATAATVQQLQSEVARLRQQRGVLKRTVLRLQGRLKAVEEDMV